MSILIQHLINGLSLGSVYALLAVGLTLIFGVGRIGNFAHGDFFMIGAFVLFVGFRQLALPYWPAALVAVAGVTVLALVANRLIFQPILPRRGPLTLFVAAMGLSIVLESLALAIWGATPRDVTTALAYTRLTLGGVTTTAQRLLAIGGAGAAFLFLQLLLYRTRIGRAIRAVSQNREAAIVVGIEVDRVLAIVFALSGTLAGIAAVLISPIYTVFPLMGLVLVLKAFAVVIVGGLGSVPGALAAALLLGVTESLAAGYISTMIQDTLAFLAMMLMLLLRPRGLFKGAALQ